MKRADDSLFYKHFGAALKAARKRARFRQKEIARMLGVHPVHLCRLENGERQISLADALYLCQVYQIDLHELSQSAALVALKEFSAYDDDHAIVPAGV